MKNNFLMNVQLISVLLFSFFVLSVKAQNVGINNTGATPHASSILDLHTGNNFISPNGKGLLIPNISLTGKDDATTVTSPALSLLIYNTATAGTGANAVAPGFYYWDGTAWNSLLAVASSTAWNTTGNAGTTSGTHFIGTTDNQALDLRTNNLVRARITTKGQIEIFNSGDAVFIGEGAGQSENIATPKGSIAIGKNALQSNVNAYENIAIGYQALKANRGYDNTAIGYESMLLNTTGGENTAIGGSTLVDNTTGSNNTTVGYTSMYENTTGGNNTAMGYRALASNRTGNENVAIGISSMSSNRNGSTNVALGSWTLNSTNGSNNVAIGDRALSSSLGNDNVAVGRNAGSNSSNGSRNVFLGNGAGQNETGNDKLYIANTNTASPLIYGDFAANSLKINGSVTINNAYTLPATAGSANQILQTDGTGNATWVTPTASAETDPQVSSATANYIPKWNGTTLVDGQVFDNGTNIGIGTATPTDKVHIVGNMKIDGGKIPFVNTGQSVFIGENAGLNDDLTNNQNVFVGWEAGKYTTTGNINAFVGHAAGQANTSGNRNSAFGQFALGSNTSGSSNTALGRAALAHNTTGFENVAVGSAALENKVAGNRNTVVGESAMYQKTSGSNNTVLGSYAGFANVSGNNNTFLGQSSGYNNTGSGNLFVGYNAGSNETGSNKLYIANSNTASPLIYGDFASNLLRVNGTLNINNAYNLPTVAGSANQVLQTNGAGATSWVNASSLSITETDPQVSSSTTHYIPTWNGTTLVDGQVFDNGTNVGIGTATPAAKLDVNGTTKTTNLQVTTGATAGYVLQSDATGNATWVNPTSLPITETDPKVSSSSSNYVPKWNGTTLIDGQVFDNGTNVGIGTATPTEKLEVSGKTKTTHLQLTNGAVNGYVLQSDAAGSATWVDPTSLPITEIDPKVASTSTNTVPKWNGTTLTDGTITDNGGNIGIGVASPANKLEVAGKTSTTNLQVTTGATAGYVLQSDAAGNGTWVDPTLLPIAETDPQVSSTTTNYIPKWNGTALVDGQVFDNGTHIGIGTLTPSEKLEVNGKTKTTNLQVTTGATAGYVLQSDATGNGTWVNSTSLPVTEVDPKVLSTTANYVPKWNGTTLVDGQVFDNGTNIGIGTATPTEKLEVSGKTKTTHLQLTNGAVNGYVLQSDAAGSATWVNSTSLPVTETDPQVSSTTADYIPKWNGTTLVDGLVFDNGTNIGIGTTSPTELLHISNGNILTDRGTAISATTRKITIGGARTGSGTSFAQIDFNNYDNNTGATDYTGASIQSQNTNSTDDGDLRFFTNNGTLTERMTITNTGNVGIGTSAPTQALLVVNGSTNTSLTSYGYLKNDGSTGTNSTGTAQNYSIYASNRIAATEFNAFSDARIKNIKGITNNRADLETLKKIEITNYTLKDSIVKGNKEYKKVIAQQIEKVYPQAVSKMTDVVPDIYKQAEIKEGRINLANSLKAGETVKLIFESGAELLTVTTANANSFTVNSSKSGKVFVFGRQVTDFRSVDYEALGTLTISATQELAKRIESLEKENAQLKNQAAGVEELRKEVEELKRLLVEKTTGK